MVSDAFQRSLKPFGLRGVSEESNAWREYFDPGSGQLWLWNEVTREAKWKEKL